MRHLVRFVVLATVLATAAACGPNAAEIRQAHEARYRGPVAELVVGASRAVVDEHYKIDRADPDAGALYTQMKVFSATGDLESAGADGVTMLSDGSIALTFLVQVGAVDEHGAYEIAIVPRIQRTVAGRSNVDELRPDDPSLPGWVHGRVDALAVAIHAQLADHELRAR